MPAYIYAEQAFYHDLRWSGRSGLVQSILSGLDYKLWMHMMLGIAYDYTETSYTDKTISCPSCPGGVGGGVPVVDGTFKTQTVTARVSYLF